MKKIIFIDRDGVINKFPGKFKYVESLEGFEFLPGSPEAIALLTRKGYSIFIISNQAGVTKGLYPKETLDKITEKLLKGIEAAGGKVEGVLYCTHTDAENCNCRKPKTGMIDQAIDIAGDADLPKTFFIGDSIRDVQTAKAAGCKSILVLSGRAKIEDRKEWELEPDFIVADLYKAVEVVLNQKND